MLLYKVLTDSIKPLPHLLIRWTEAAVGDRSICLRTYVYRDFQSEDGFYRTDQYGSSRRT